jgi:UDP-N-acetylmuramyl pentapeptide phosphotransferase/UDP-N-acetylglucosamine-1-phosphate transferase
LIWFLVGVLATLAVPTSCFSMIPFLAVWLWGSINAYNVAAGKTPLWV